MTVAPDSWAVLRYLEDVEPCASAVHRLLRRERPVMSWINLGEVFSVVHRAHGEDDAAATVRGLRTYLTCVLPSAELVLDAARVKAQHPLAHADAFAAATAAAHDATLWTGDPELLVDGAPWRWRDLRA